MVNLVNLWLQMVERCEPSDGSEASATKLAELACAEHVSTRRPVGRRDGRLPDETAPGETGFNTPPQVCQSMMEETKI
jgi:hypothetical protein